MKKSYKIGLIGVGIIFAVVIGYYFFQEPDEGRAGRPVVASADTSRSTSASLMRPSLAARPAPVIVEAPSAQPTVAVAPAAPSPGAGALAWNPGAPVQPAAAGPAPAAAPARFTASTQPTVTFQPAARLPSPSTQPVAGGIGATRTVTSVSAASTAEATRTYAIKANDTFASIAVATYGSAEYADEIAFANPLVDPRKLKVGQTIRLPSLQQIAQQRKPTASAAEAPGQVYVTRANDTLWSIAVQVYGDGTKWQQIYRANRERIGANPDALEEGLKLRIPPKEGSVQQWRDAGGTHEFSRPDQG